MDTGFAGFAGGEPERKSLSHVANLSGGPGAGIVL